MVAEDSRGGDLCVWQGMGQVRRRAAIDLPKPEIGNMLLSLEPGSRSIAS